MAIAGKAIGELGKAEGEARSLAARARRGRAARKKARWQGCRARGRRPHQDQKTAQAMFERADMAGKGAQGAGLQLAGRQTLGAPMGSHQYKDQAAQELPGAARGAGGLGLCEGNAAFDHAAKIEPSRYSGGFESRDLP